ncbi:histidine kinase [Nitrosarchaeum sp. AC2]|uniref:histidine kinase n=1 Tax=Nitrosarchaeum sp. AC2 TaxID=2259673 RepID=UPI0015C885D1|nr:histidine kinase [Nitrosarchaeum sp. AC2]QLH10706.1 histidine kinase [Nitrosarchaeum sp. AC2]
MKTPDIVAEKVDSPINYKILAGIILAAICFQLTLTFVFSFDESDLIISIVSLLNPLAVAIIGFFLAYRYKGSLIFGKSYLFLSLGFFSLFVAEVTYSVYDLILEIEPYPSIADIFFFAYIPLLIAHLIINIRFFQPSIKNLTKIGIIAVPIMITVAYGILSINEIGEANFDFYYGIIFVAATSVALTLTILGTRIFKEGALGKSWWILLFGVLALTFADDWYYYLEIIESYDLTHPVNILWYAGYWIIAYALLKHKKII